MVRILTVQVHQKLEIAPLSVLTKSISGERISIIDSKTDVYLNE